MAVHVPPGPLRPAPLDQHRRRGTLRVATQTRWSNGRVLVLNATFEPINVCTVRRATVLLLKEKAEIVEHGAYELRSTSTTMPRPMVIRLVAYVRVPRDTHRRKITRRAVFARDRWDCQYCGARSYLTVDHVVPRSRGGADAWENLVWSSKTVNTRKGNRLPHEAGLRLLNVPRAPKELPVSALIRNAHGIAEWKLFLNDKA